MEIKLYNSLSNQLEVFHPIKENELSMYVCGPTVYNDIHIGNARPVVFFDTVARFFKALGYKVTYVSNYTDIDDKIIKKAKEEGLSEKEVAEKYIEHYNAICNALNATMVDVHPRVTQWINGIIGFIDELVQKGCAYQVGDNVYFRVRSDDKYGVLSNQRLDDLEVGSRIEAVDDKEDPRDFVLWKLTKDEGIKWDSPFGVGRPGWHTECCVMIDQIFGGGIDIHGGGNDLKFPHHENEIAQTYALKGHYIANYWIHNGRVDVNNTKMSKSLGNFILAKDLIAKYNPNAIRLMLLSSNYRQNFNYTAELMDASAADFDRIARSYLSLYRSIELANAFKEAKPLEVYNAFLAEMAQDFNTPNAITILYQVLKDVNIALRQREKDYALLNQYLATLDAMLFVLGLKVDVNPLTIEQKELVNKWNEARSNKDFTEADRLRALITEQGIVL